jgi:hypothetical protein
MSQAPQPTPGRASAMMAAISGGARAAMMSATTKKGVGFQNSDMISGKSSPSRNNGKLTMQALHHGGQADSFNNSNNNNNNEYEDKINSGNPEDEDVIDTLALDEDNNQNKIQNEEEAKSKKEKSLWAKYCDWGDGLPCGLSMTVIMSVILLLPCVFLVTYTAIPLAKAVTAQKYMKNHRGIVSNMVFVGEAMRIERRDSSLLASFDITNGSGIFSPSTSTTTAATTTQNSSSTSSPAPPSNNIYNSHFPSSLIFYNKSQVRARLVETRKDVEDRFHNLLSDLLGSDSDAQQLAISENEAFLKEISIMRERVDAKTISPREIRQQYKRLQDRVFMLVLQLFVIDKRAESIEKLYILFMLNLRNENNIAMIRDAISAIFLQGEHSELSLNLRDLHVWK